MAKESEHPGAEVVELLRVEIEIGLNAIDALGRKLALIPAFLGTMAALLVSDPVAPVQGSLVLAAIIPTVAAVGLALWN